MASIRVEELWKRYGRVEAVKGLTLTCADGELLALLGPSGCGKTSTLKMLAGIEEVTQGRVYFGEQPVTRLAPAERNVAMIFEDYALYPHLSVAQNVAFPLHVRRRPRVETEAAVRKAALADLRATAADQDKARDFLLNTSMINSVREAAAIGIPDKQSGEAVKLFVVRADPTLSEADVLSHMRANLTPYKVPRHVEFIEELPKSTVGKVLRRALKDQRSLERLPT